jgi:hypothetical protein
MLLNAGWQFGNILLLSSNDSIGSFYWIRGSQHCFLTSFSNLNCIILFLVIWRNRYLLVSLGLSWLHGNLISHPVYFYTFGSLSTTLYMRPHISGTHDAFSRSKMLMGTWSKNLYRFSFPVPPFTEGFSCKRPLGNCKSYLFFSRKIPQTDIFLRYISLH